MTTRYERRCLTLLRAYPPRDPAARGDELLGTLLDAATPGRETPSVRESWDVIRDGLTTRLRAHPPVWRWLLYRGYSARLPYAYRWWARDDVLGRWFHVRDNPGHVLLGPGLAAAGPARSPARRRTGLLAAHGSHPCVLATHGAARRRPPAPPRTAGRRGLPYHRPVVAPRVIRVPQR